jgi:lipopolysaccharide export system permease protein
MTTLGAYVLRLTLTPLLLTVVVALLVLLMDRMLNMLSVVLSSSGALQPLLQLLTFLTPQFLAMALPVGFFISVLLAILGLHQRSELDVISGTGIGLLALLRPILGLALLLTALAALNIGWAQPYGRYLYRAVMHDVKNIVTNIWPQEGTFMEIAGITFMAEEVNLTKQEFSKLFIYREDKDGGLEVITAKSGQLWRRPDGQGSVLTMQDGVRLAIPKQIRVTAKMDEASRAPPESIFRTMMFDRLQVPIDLPTATLFRARGADEREFTLAELWPYAKALPSGLTPTQVRSEFHDRAVHILSILILPFLAAGLAVGQRRVQRAYIVAVGLVLLIVYNEILLYGRELVYRGQLSSLVGQWLPFMAMLTMSGILFYRAAFRVPSTWLLYQLMDWLHDAVRRRLRPAGAIPG